MKVAFDTSAIVPLVLASHPQHDAAKRAWLTYTKRPHRPIVPAHALLEAYSVLTRLPMPHRVPLKMASQALRVAFEGAAVADGANPTEVLARAVEAGIGGGRVYDLAIAESALAAGADALLTFNERDFAFADRIRVIVPA